MCLNLDLQLSICSYFNLNEVLYLFEDNCKTRDLILKRYKYYYPTWDQVIIHNDYRVAKFYLDIKFLPNKSSLKQAIDRGNLDMLKLLNIYNIEFGIEELNDSAFNGNYDVFMFLINIGINPTSKTLRTIQNAYDIISEDNMMGNVINTVISDYEKIISYLKEKLKI